MIDRYTIKFGPAVSQKELEKALHEPGETADEITVSAPRGRVDLEALKRPRLGGKEPSDDDYRV
jgi:hypothetical protein